MKKNHILGLAFPASFTTEDTEFLFHPTALNEACVIMPRQRLEDVRNPEHPLNKSGLVFVHPISYVIFTRTVNGVRQFLQYTRDNSTRLEKDLDAKTSIGFGGHVEFKDVVVDAETGIIDFTKSMINNIANNEIPGEVWFEPQLSINGVLPKKQPAGSSVQTATMNDYMFCMYDDSTPVNSIHLGVVALFELAPDTEARLPAGNEEKITLNGWVEMVTLLDDPTLEDWSRIALETLVDHFKSSQP